MIRYLVLAVILGLMACTMDDSKPVAGDSTRPTTQGTTMKTQTATFAAGCFWGVQSTFDKVPGVISTRAGYTGGHFANPTYRDVCGNQTGHAEAIEIKYDPDTITYQQLLTVFFENHDPTTFDRQGPDVGTQYRSEIFYHTPEQQKLAQAEIKRRNDSGDYVNPIVTQVAPATTFYAAEDYHQEYFKKNGENWTCHTGNGKKAGVHARQ